MLKICNTLLGIDMLLLIIGMVSIWVRPYGVDISCGIVIIATGFLFSTFLFLVKLKITSQNE